MAPWKKTNHLPAVEESASSRTSTLRSASDKAEVGLLKCALQKILADLLSFRRVGLAIVRVCVHLSLFGVPHLSQHLCLAPSTWMTGVDILVHLNELTAQVLDTLQIFVHQWWFPSAGLHFHGVDEGVQEYLPSPLRCVKSPTPSWTAASWNSLLPPYRSATRVFFGSRFGDSDGLQGRDACAGVFDCWMDG